MPDTAGTSASRQRLGAAVEHLEALLSARPAVTGSSVSAEDHEALRREHRLLVERYGRLRESTQDAVRRIDLLLGADAGETQDGQS